MVGTYVPLKDQCWIFSCKRLAAGTVTIQGHKRVVCKIHGKQYGPSAERKLRS
jgi:nitrite reductase/ring-hydroxylating ferredoxin subunit